jgi:hypothetical protein
MFRSDKPTNYEDVYTGLVDRLAAADFPHAVQHLGAVQAGNDISLDCFGRTCLIGPDGVFTADGSELDFTIRIVLAYYILHRGSGDLSGRWVAYRDFKDGAFFHASFSQIVENQIALDFSGRLEKLLSDSRRLMAVPLEAGLGGDACLRFPALPNVPLTLVFYDQDEEFPASARVLFDASAPNFLDMECLAVMGLILADQLRLTVGI